MLGPTPRYKPFHPSCTLMSRKECHICFPMPPCGLLVATWSLTLSRSSGCMHSTATTPAPSPAAAWSCVMGQCVFLAKNCEYNANQCSSRKETRGVLGHAKVYGPGRKGKLEIRGHG